MIRSEVVRENDFSALSFFPVMKIEPELLVEEHLKKTENVIVFASWTSISVPCKLFSNTIQKTNQTILYASIMVHSCVYNVKNVVEYKSIRHLIKKES